MVRISLDNQNHDISPSFSQQPAFLSDILDPSIPHTIRVIKMNPEREWIALDSFIVTYPDPSATNPDRSVTSTEQATTIIYNADSARPIARN